MKPVWDRLVRFEGADGKTYYGQPIIASADDLDKQVAAGTLQAKVLEGDDIFAETAVLTNTTINIKKLLGPLTAEDVPIMRCIGLNYMGHIKEAGRKTPTHPMYFLKPSTCVADWGENIPIPKLAQDDQCDYEGEMCLVIGKAGKDIPKERALEYVGGYLCGNDVSSRKWQRDPELAGPVPQFNFSKGFDKYAPMGPMLVSPKLVGAADNLPLQTRVNGELRQDSSTADLLFDVPALIAFLSQGTTLEKGSVIMTGTPSGAGFGMKPPQWLKHGDTVEVTIGELGTLRNKIVFT